MASSGLQFIGTYWIICQARKLRLVARRAGEVHEEHAGPTSMRERRVRRRPAQQASRSFDDQLLLVAPGQAWIE